jgi:hypothetical protein
MEGSRSFREQDFSRARSAEAEQGRQKQSNRGMSAEQQRESAEQQRDVSRAKRDERERGK